MDFASTEFIIVHCHDERRRRLPGEGKSAVPNRFELLLDALKTGQNLHSLVTLRLLLLEEKAGDRRSEHANDGNAREHQDHCDESALRCHWSDVPIPTVVTVEIAHHRASPKCRMPLVLAALQPKIPTAPRTTVAQATTRM